MKRIPILFILLFLAWASSSSASAPGPAPRRELLVAYFCPSDRAPRGDWAARLDRVMTDLQAFYAEGMRTNGYGGRGFALRRDAQGGLGIHLVRGEQPCAYYTFERGGAVRDEVRRALRAGGVDLDDETVVIFEDLATLAGNRLATDGPAGGCGGPWGGTAWVVDHPLIDPINYKETARATGWRGAEYPLGRFASMRMGAAAQALGLALGLPYLRETPAEAGRGSAMMSARGAAYRAEWRDEGPGAFLTAAEAMLLRAHPLFDPAAARPAAVLPRARFEALSFRLEQGRLRGAGRLSGDMPAHGIVALNAPCRPGEGGGDDAAVGWTAPVDGRGAFEIETGAAPPGPAELRLLICHTNGAVSRLACRYPVDAAGAPDLAALNGGLLVERALDAFHAGEAAALDRLAAEAAAAREAGAAAGEKIRHLRRLLRPPEIALPDAVPGNVRVAHAGNLVWSEGRAGGQGAARNRLHDGRRVLLECGGAFHPFGLAAHAPSLYRFDVNGRWKTFSSSFGLQDGHAGSAVFVVRGDGRELFRSPVVRDATERTMQADIAGVKRLELAVEDAGDGPGGDWGAWLSPELQR